MSEQSAFSLNCMLHCGLLAFVLVFGCAGCSRFQNQLDDGDEIENVKGTWRGTLTSVTLYDDDGKEYEGAALRITSGPSLPTPVQPVHGDGSLPILVTNTLPCRILDPSSLPLGSPATVKGIMCINHACVRKEQQVRGPSTLLRINDPNRPRRWEHVIMVTSSPKPDRVRQ